MSLHNKSRISALVALLAVSTAMTPVSSFGQAAGPQGPSGPARATPSSSSPAAAPRITPIQPAEPSPVQVIRNITVTGSERLEPETVRSYISIAPGDRYDRELLDEALKKLYATELFADVQIRDDNGALTISVRENPIINRVVFEGNKSLKEDKLREEVKLAPRQIYTRSKVRADVSRILELARRSGKFAANVNPKAVQLPQNRIDLVFEINEGPKSKVRQINILGNKKFSDRKLLAEMATKQARWWRLFTSNDTYDPDRLSYDREKLRQFYLTEGYVDFRIVSALAELGPDRKDFIETFSVEEGERYKFGKIDVESKIRDLKPETLSSLIRLKEGDWYNAKKIENTVESLTETAGLFGYAFADIRPKFNRNKETRTMDVTFQVNEAPRVYVESININGNVRTLDKVIRREFRLAEGDAFNSFKVKRSKDRIQALGYFQEKLEIEQKPGSTPDKVKLEVNVEEKSTGELQVGVGFSSLERFIADFSIKERNFLGKGQELRLNFTLSSYRNELDLGFTEPYFLGRNLAAGIDLFRRDLNSFRYTGSGNNDRRTTYGEVTTGLQLRSGFPITEFWSLGVRYGLSVADVSLDRDIYFSNGRCDLFNAGSFLCDLVGNTGTSKRTTSSLGYTLVYDSRNSRIRPSRGQNFTFSQDLAGIGGGLNYVRTTANYDRYYQLWENWIVKLSAEGGYIFGWGGEDVRINDRFFLGSPRIRGFRIRGIGPRAVRTCLGAPGCSPLQAGVSLNDSIGGEIYYLGGAEMEVPLGSAASELGLRTSVFADIGSLWKVGRTPAAGVAGIQEFVQGNSPSPRISVGVGVSWNSPFGPFRIDLAKALSKQPGDEPQLFQFNVGTQF